MVALIIMLIALAIGLIFKLLQERYAYWKKRGVPYEEPIFGYGNIKGMGKSIHFRDINQRIYRKFKGRAPFVGMYMLIQKAALITDLELVKSILIRDFANFTDRGLFHNERDDPLTAHLINLEGEVWHAMRNKLTPIFTTAKIKLMFPTMVGVSENLVAACESLITKSGSKHNIEVKELSARFTTDVIGTCAFGIECNSLQDPNAEFRLRGRSIFEIPRHSSAIYSFIFSYPKLARFLRMKFFTDDAIEFFTGAVRQTVEYRLKHAIKRNDFMGLLMELMAKDQHAAVRCGSSIDLSHGLTIFQMAAQAFVFFVAGFHTSSTTLSFCLYELALNAHVQQKLRAEIVDVLAKHAGELTYEAMSEMHYLDQVVNETLRKHSAIPHLIRKAKENYTVPGTKLIIEKGTSLFIPVHSIHHDPEIYPEPEKFDPSRFSSEAAQQRHAAAYLPFGDGPRYCIGMRFGQMQVKIGLIALLKNFKFSKSPDTEVPPIYNKKEFLLTAPLNDVYLHIESIHL